MRRIIRPALLALSLVASLPAPGPAATLRWAAARDIGSLDPDSFGDTFTLAFLNHVYEGLVRYDDHLKIEPALAERWEIIEPQVWRFHLRQGVRFHDGAPLTADDVVASLKRATATPGGPTAIRTCWSGRPCSACATISAATTSCSWRSTP